LSGPLLRKGLAEDVNSAKLGLLPTVSRPVCLGVRLPSGTSDKFFFLLEIFFKQLPVGYFVSPSLTRGQVCNMLLLLVLASAVPRNSGPYFIVPILQTCPTWRARSLYLYPTGTGSPRYIPWALGSLFVASYDSQGYGGGILTRLHTGKSEIFLLYIIYRNSVCTSQESHYVILTRLHTRKSEIFLLAHI
jgi:hypothetical protein